MFELHTPLLFLGAAAALVSEFSVSPDASASVVFELSVLPEVTVTVAGSMSELSVSPDASVSAAGTVTELSVFPDANIASMEAASELFVSPDGSVLTTKAIFELSESSDCSVCPDATMEVVPKFPVCLDLTTGAKTELSACSDTAPETNPNLSLLSVVPSTLPDPIWSSLALFAQSWWSFAPSRRSSAPYALLW